MTKKESKKEYLLKDLREKALSRLELLEENGRIDYDNIQEVIQELNIHQVELMMQKDELKAKQKDLEKSRNEYFRLFELAPVGYFIFDQEGVLLDVNSFGARLLNQTQKNLYRKPFMLYIDTDYQKNFIAHRNKVINSLGPLHTILKLRNRSKEKIWVRVTSVSFAQEEGQPLRCFSVMENVSELYSALETQKKLNKDLEQANARLVREIENRKTIEKELIESRNAAEIATRVKSEFLANMSHELRTPLNGIMGALQFLETQKLDQDLMEMVTLARNSGTGILRILNDILDFSTLEAKEPGENKKQFSIQQAVNQVLESYQSVINQKGLRVNLDMSDRIPVQVCGDEPRFRQIMFNLVGNAVKFTEKGSLTIQAGPLQEADSHVLMQFTIADTGPGIPEKLINEVVKPFTQADSSFTRKYGGIGLGLALSSRIIRKMGGEFNIDSQTGKGTSIKFTLNFSTHCPAQSVFLDQ